MTRTLLTGIRFVIGLLQTFHKILITWAHRLLCASSYFFVPHPVYEFENYPVSRQIPIPHTNILHSILVYNLVSVFVLGIWKGWCFDQNYYVRGSGFQNLEAEASFFLITPPFSLPGVGLTFWVVACIYFAFITRAGGKYTFKYI